MPKEKLQKGEKTDRALAAAIRCEKPLHYRLNTVGDMPNAGFFQAVLDAVIDSESTAFGYTHWQPETELGRIIRELSDQHWERFAVRTSYKHGSRESLKSQAAVILPEGASDEELDELLKLHNAIICPEEVNTKKNCGECGLCWLVPDKNIAFPFH